MLFLVSESLISVTNEPVKWHVYPVKTQIRLAIIAGLTCPVCWFCHEAAPKIKIASEILFLSYDIMSRSEITPYIKIDKPLVVYRFW